MQLAGIRSSVSLSISILGTLLIGRGFFLPIYTISPPTDTNSSNPYPPVVNGWQAISTLPSTGTLLVFVFVAAVILLCTSLLLLFQKSTRRVNRIRILLSFACIALLIFVTLNPIFMNFADLPDGAAASPTFAVGQGFWMVLTGLALCGLGVGSASIGAFIGTCLGIVIGYFLTLGVGVSLSFLSRLGLPGIGAILSLTRNFSSIALALWLGISILGSILGGWLFRKIQAGNRRRSEQLYRSYPTPRSLSTERLRQPIGLKTLYPNVKRLFLVFCASESEEADVPARKGIVQLIVCSRCLNRRELSRMLSHTVFARCI